MKAKRADRLLILLLLLFTGNGRGPSSTEDSEDDDQADNGAERWRCPTQEGAENGRLDARRNWSRHRRIFYQ